MAIYVDEPIHPFKRSLACHMFADTLQELHHFAVYRLGLKRIWFQNDVRLPHYDIILSKRRLAIKFGAIEVDRRFVYERIKYNVKEYERKRAHRVPA